MKIMEFIKHYKLIFYLWVVISTIFDVHANIRWLSYEHYPANALWEKNQVCSKQYGLTGKQVRFCRRQFHWMEPIQEASKRSSEECMFLLSQDKWNCMSLTKSPNYEADLKKDTQQAALVYALSSASLSIATSRGCMTGQIPECSCLNPKRQSSFPSNIIDKTNLTNIDNMLPCKDVTIIGKQFAKQFTHLGFRTKAKNDQQRKTVAVKKHNIGIGLKEIGDKEEISCVCNGATAGCVMKFCHRYVVRFEEIAKKLVNKYHHARHISEEDFMKKRQNGIEAYTLNSLHENSLVYTKSSEDLCASEKTAGRICVVDTSKSNSCMNLCCGRGYREKIIKISSQCRCEFVYCCKVKCDTCERTESVLECL